MLFVVEVNGRQLKFIEDSIGAHFNLISAGVRSNKSGVGGGLDTREYFMDVVKTSGGKVDFEYLVVNGKAIKLFEKHSEKPGDTLHLRASEPVKKKTEAEKLRPGYPEKGYYFVYKIGSKSHILKIDKINQIKGPNRP